GAGKTVGDVRHYQPAVDRCRAAHQRKIEILRVVQALQVSNITRVEPWNPGEYRVIHDHAVRILTGGLAVFGKAGEFARLQGRPFAWPRIIRKQVERGGIPRE